MKAAFEMWMDKQVKELHQLLMNIKAQLSKQGIKIQSEKVDGDFTLYIVLEKGKAFV